MSAIFERWPRGRALYNGRIHDVWIDPNPDHRVRVTKARAKRTAKALGVPTRRVPAGTWIPIVIDGPGHVVVPESALRPYNGPRFEAPLRVLKKGTTATGRSRE